jgi:septum formation protein
MLLPDKLKNTRLILGSASQRRLDLLRGLGLDFSVQVLNVPEDFSPALKREQIAVYLAEKKAQSFAGSLEANEILITADTIVWLEGTVLNKPADLDEARKMLSAISGKKHEVVTGVCLSSVSKTHSFFAVSEVHFKQLLPDEIEHYIQTYRPLDKAGAYGIQEWIGYIGVTSISGCYYNIMGLPLHDLYAELIAF